MRFTLALAIHGLRWTVVVTPPAHCPSPTRYEAYSSPTWGKIDGPEALREQVLTSERFKDGELDGKVAVVTGASSGIGEATAEALAAQGAALVVAARREERLNDLVGRIESDGGRVFPVACDVTDEEQAHELIQRAREELGRIDILVNNAGVITSSADDLKRHGLSYKTASHSYGNVFPDGTSLRVYQDQERTLELLRDHNPRDAEGFQRLHERYKAFGEAFLPIYGTSLHSSRAAWDLVRAARSRGLNELTELTQIILSSTRELGDAYFETREMKALVAAWGMHLDSGSHATPVEALYQCGASTYPGPD